MQSSEKRLTVLTLRGLLPQTHWLGLSSAHTIYEAYMPPPSPTIHCLPKSHLSERALLKRPSSSMKLVRITPTNNPTHVHSPFPFSFPYSAFGTPASCMMGL